MMATTIRSSIREKPFSFRLFRVMVLGSTVLGMRRCNGPTTLFYRSGNSFAASEPRASSWECTLQPNRGSHSEASLMGSPVQMLPANCSKCLLTASPQNPSVTYNKQGAVQVAPNCATNFTLSAPFVCRNENTRINLHSLLERTDSHRWTEFWSLRMIAQCRRR